MSVNTQDINNKTLIVITGPTGIGKSATAIDLAQRLSTEIISADSRQVYKGIPIITAAPTEEERSIVPHHLVDFLELDEYYSASLFEQQALSLLDQIFRRSDYAVVCGGSMMYVDALCNGIDELPTIPDNIRQQLMQEHADNGNDWLLQRLEQLDPVYYNQVDRQNTKRVFHAVEICLASGKPYSSLRTGTRQSRPFRIIKTALTADRQLIFDRINFRVEKMLKMGMLDEARSVYHLRHLNSLNTVGFKEMFRYFDGEWDLPTAIARMQKNTRVYAKKQMTWYQRDPLIHWIDASAQATPT
ncbi:MAG: tRNA (adenosine(37)-N6)-dimethylallyltransferase MiaA, partial [Muribaculaceae bacterium]|nr:tRNA (adenosine(37)-N6)-dimethylallyltransferase MiaA [Muribaculaceae bacterium]